MVKVEYEDGSVELVPTIETPPDTQGNRDVYAQIPTKSSKIKHIGPVEDGRWIDSPYVKPHLALFLDNVDLVVKD